MNVLKNLYLKKAISTKSFWQFKRIIQRRANIVRYQREPFELRNFTHGECMLFFRFTSDEIRTLLCALRIPKINRLKNRVKFTGTINEKQNQSQHSKMFALQL